VHFEKETFLSLNFDEVGPVEALASCRQVGKVRESRRGEDFIPVQPIAFATTAAAESPADEMPTLMARIGTLRDSFRKFQNKGSRLTTDRAATEEN
jgi:hypothetical protein